MKLLFTVRSVIGMIGLISVTGIFSVWIIFLSFLPTAKQRIDKVIKAWGRVSCFLLGVKVVVKGLENQPQKGCVFLFSHTSFFDIFAMAAVIPGIRFGAKIELFKIPFFGAAMRRAGTLPIARNRREEVFRVYEEARVRFALGHQFALAPEGTRQEQEVLGKFKAGPFVFAIQAQVPVVPVVIRGALAVMPKGAWWPNTHSWIHTIYVDVLAPIETARFSVDERPVLQAEVFEKMQVYFS